MKQPKAKKPLPVKAVKSRSRTGSSPPGALPIPQNERLSQSPAIERLTERATDRHPSPKAEVRRSPRKPVASKFKEFQDPHHFFARWREKSCDRTIPESHRLHDDYLAAYTAEHQRLMRATERPESLCGTVRRSLTPRPRLNQFDRWVDRVVPPHKTGIHDKKYIVLYWPRAKDDPVVRFDMPIPSALPIAPDMMLAVENYIHDLTEERREQERQEELEARRKEVRPAPLAKAPLSKTTTPVPPSAATPQTTTQRSGLLVSSRSRKTDPSPSARQSNRLSADRSMEGDAVARRSPRQPPARLEPAAGGLHETTTRKGSFASQLSATSQKSFAQKPPRPGATTVLPPTQTAVAPAVVPQIGAPAASPRTGAPPGSPRTRIPAVSPRTGAPDAAPQSNAPDVSPQIGAPSASPQTKQTSVPPQPGAAGPSPRLGKPSASPRTGSLRSLRSKEGPTSLVQGMRRDKAVSKAMSPSPSMTSRISPSPRIRSAKREPASTVSKKFSAETRPPSGLRAVSSRSKALDSQESRPKSTRSSSKSSLGAQRLTSAVKAEDESKLEEISESRAIKGVDNEAAEMQSAEVPTVKKEETKSSPLETISSKTSSAGSASAIEKASQLGERLRQESMTRMKQATTGR